MAEQLQQLILDKLALHNTIDDSRTLTIPGDAEPATSQEAQLVIQGALNSLLSKEVNSSCQFRSSADPGTNKL